MNTTRAFDMGRVVLMTTATLFVSLIAGGQQASTQTEPHQMRMTGTSTMTKAQKIANAMTAAPASISEKAAVLDWPGDDGGQPMTLRAGTNGWSCLPDMPETK